MFATEGGSAWGPAIKMDPYDLATFLLDFTAGVTTSSVEIRAQISEYKNKDASVWHDFYTLDPVGGAFVRWTASFITAVSVQIAWSSPVRAKYMRFMLFAPGADQTNSRAVLKAVLDKNGV